MPRQMSSRERALRERWPKWRCGVMSSPFATSHGYVGRAFLYDRHGLLRGLITGYKCTRRSDAWRSLERAMLRTATALGADKERVVYVYDDGSLA